MGQKKVQTSSVCIEAFKSLAGVFFLQGYEIRAQGYLLKT